MRTLVCLALALGFNAALAEEPAAIYPSKAIRLFGQGTGSTADYLSRFVAQRLQERWGQPVIVDSRSGAGGTIPTDIVAKSPPDGYNLVMGHAGPFVSAVTLYAKTLPYDPLKDFEPVALVASGPYVLVVNPQLPVHSVRELIAAAKAQPGKIDYASSGNGSAQHLVSALFASMAGIELNHVPYKGSAPAMPSNSPRRTSVGTVIFAGSTSGSFEHMST